MTAVKTALENLTAAAAEVARLTIQDPTDVRKVWAEIQKTRPVGATPGAFQGEVGDAEKAAVEAVVAPGGTALHHLAYFRKNPGGTDADPYWEFGMRNLDMLGFGETPEKAALDFCVRMGALRDFRDDHARLLETLKKKWT